MRTTLIIATFFAVFSAFADFEPKPMDLDLAANAEIEKFIGSYRVVKFEAKLNGLTTAANDLSLEKIVLAKSRNPSLPTQGSFDLDLYVNEEAYTRWEMWNNNAVLGGEDGIPKDGVSIRLEMIKRHPSWKKVSYAVSGNERTTMTDILSFERQNNTTLFRQKRTVLTYRVNDPEKATPVQIRNEEYIYTLKKE